MLKVQYYILLYRVDLLLLILMVTAGCLWISRQIRRRGSQYRLPGKSFLTAGLIVVAGGLAAEWAAQDRIKSLEKLFAGFGPTYASELRQQGHEYITLDTPANDPRYLEIIEHEKSWLAVNPIIADVYTFRKDAAGKIRLMVDSETDYDHSGKIDDPREERTPIGEVYEESTPKFYRALEGETVFESEFMPDRWGIWVSSFTPIYDHNGHVEAAVGIDYPAASWLAAIGSTRAMCLGITLVLVIIVLTSGTFITYLAAEIEERKQTQRRLEQASDSAFSASAAKSEFLALMSHEVRNPLTAILGFANILTDTRLDPKQRRYVDTINRAGTTLIDLLNDILDYTKVESGKLTLERIAWAPAMLVHEVMELMTLRAEEKGLQLNFENQLPGDLTLQGDPTRIRQVLLNLVSNAVKFTAAGSVTVRADWQPSSSKADHGRLTIVVTDTGIGIPAEKIPQLFQAFAQADTATTRHHGGTGLGLAICRRLSDMMGGRISLQSQVGIGSVFTFTLACDSIKACSLESKPHAGTAPPIAIWTRALVVDDTKLNRELLKVMLRRLGLEADVASSGPEAVQLDAQNRYGIIFTDLEMPDMDGFATARAIRAQEPVGRHTPIVAVSALTASGTREKCIAAGMDDYLTKPVYLPALKSTIEAMLPQFRASQSVPPFPARTAARAPEAAA